MTKIRALFFLAVLLTIFCNRSFSQNMIEYYNPVKNDSLRIGTEENDILPYIQSGYTLMLPEETLVKGVLIFLEDSEYDKKNRSAKEMYNQASKEGFAVLSVSTEIPLDFYFSDSSIGAAHELIQQAFATYDLPNNNVFFLGASLVGHRAMQYIKSIKERDDEFQLNITGIVICNFTLDWTRKWHQHERDIRIDRIDLREPKLINYMLETHLKGTPKTVPENYHDFSPYSYFDEKNRNISVYKDYAIRAYAEPSIKYRLTKYYRTMYDNNTTDIVGFLAELRLAGNENTDLVVIQPEDKPSAKKSSQKTWEALDKNDLMEWIVKQTEQ